jgi:NAD(P)-dependent dehydrogenase (short-subunit alcohol dehydrogenase family)
MNMLDGKVAFITGGASGIGKGTAIHFAHEGASVGIADVPEQEDDAHQVIAEIEGIGARAVFLPCDVSQPEQVKRAVDDTVNAFGGLHIVFANAGINGVWTPVDELKPDEWDRTLDINLKGTYLTVHYAVPHLKRAGEGSIIICSSVNGNRTFANTGASAYSTSKAGQVAFMKMMALELARFNIRVNAVLPGAIHTNIQERTEKRNTEKIEIKMVLPEGKPGIDHGQGEPGEVADTCLFLAGHLSRHVSGAEIYVDGGSSLLR